MTSLSLEEVSIDPASHVDPNGALFHYRGEIYRAIKPAAQEFYRELLDKGALRDAPGLIETSLSDFQLPELGSSMVLKHRKITPLSYCVEWCPSMLQDAALLTLDLAIDLNRRGYALQDAYPWNILFDGASPVHVDFTSIVASKPGLLWPAYQQFLDFFYHPLLLASVGKGKLARLFCLNNIEGVTSEELMRHLPLSYWLRHPISCSGSAAGIALSKIVQGNTSLRLKLQSAAQSGGANRDMAALRGKFFSKLRAKIANMSFVRSGQEWSAYYRDLEAQNQNPGKLSRVETILSELKPASLLDAGSNTGKYSLVAARQGIRVISIDSSEACIEALYGEAKRGKLPVTPIIADLCAPTPAFGYLSRQFPPMLERLRSECGLFLGLMHHLHVRARQDFGQIAALVDRLVSKSAIFEFVGCDDGNLSLIEHGREIRYDLTDVTGALEKHFRLTVFDSDRATRKLIICER